RCRPGARAASPAAPPARTRSARAAGGPRPRRRRRRRPRRPARGASNAHAWLPYLTRVLTLEDAIATARTGDIWLFRGRSLADRAIQTMTNSPVNHVGMAVAIDDLQPLMWHAELGRSLPDVWTGERQRGVQLHVLRDAVATWADRYG